MVKLLARCFEHHRWANLRAVAACRDLTEAQLDATVTGTYGSIRDTLLHLAGAEQRYLHRLADRVPTFHERDGWLGLDAVQDALDATGQVFIALADAREEDALLETVYQGAPVTLHRSTILVQAITHATEHRSQIATILTQQGIAPPTSRPGPGELPWAEPASNGPSARLPDTSTRHKVWTQHQEGEATWLPRR